jgi:hypothetical protein
MTGIAGGDVNMGDAQKVQISDGFDFGFWAGFGALSAIGMMFLIGGGVDWVVNKLSSHTAHYVISVQPRQVDTSDETYIAEDYSRKLSGQIVFVDCGTARQITLSPSSYKIEIATITDKNKAQTCKVEP